MPIKIFVSKFGRNQLNHSEVIKTKLYLKTRFNLPPVPVLHHVILLNISVADIQSQQGSCHISLPSLRTKQ